MKLLYTSSATVYIHGGIHNPEPWEYRFDIWGWSRRHAKKRAEHWIERDKPGCTIARLDVQ